MVVSDAMSLNAGLLTYHTSTKCTKGVLCRLFSVAQEVIIACVNGYGQAVQELADAAGYTLGVGQAQWQVGCALSDQGLWAEAEAPLRRSLQVLESQLRPDHPDLACVCNGAPYFTPIDLSPCFGCECVRQGLPPGPRLFLQWCACPAVSSFLIGQSVIQSIYSTRSSHLDLIRWASELAPSRCVQWSQRSVETSHRNILPRNLSPSFGMTCV